MQDLTAVGLSPDGRQLLLVDGDGTEYAVRNDTRLRSLVGERAARRSASSSPGPTQGHLEIKMDSALRPRDIQSRIRSGETPEDVATAAGTTVDSIMAFAGPVLAERAHVAQTARKASVRRRSNEASVGARTLGETADLFFAGHTLHDEDVEWDAWRRPDGRWALTAVFSLEGRERTAEFTHDLSGRYVVAENNEARLLTGELRDTPSGITAGTTAAPTQRDRRLSSVPAEHPSQDALPLGDDTLEMVRESGGVPEIPEAVLPVDAGHDIGPDVVQEAVEEAASSDVATHDEPAAEPDEADTAWDQADEEPTVDVRRDDEAPAADDAPAEERTSRKKGRSSVPSWDEIMFGGGSAE